ncbi:BspA family leucine-rich repeat surface protein [Companilactobacillus sp.]|jgi:surface protein|uniref:BspA family leucine-rich repeat surface protein n=1 Tax=Companilactobacillus sp. TaxID=2767905 RepID=UPI0025B8791B|nr:BspA family leucine-rich repeat surface protein [Companilactobacillus sp.]MCH4009223.1 DUF285 domain-containing protein [Companilactobacillus sp.]MCH4050598.1 DUF285 domain-containing protein [Companilactobacillus sp.]MCH4077165.1 DUF285 domain-containing protein [Companilactobacillus sp.]MCH4125741.1 DUF285 domain-containing protein [Companilactobacillus sp.]MCI1311450.1 DUF285 domain-containing protein [Companilactobacillus sp.]
MQKEYNNSNHHKKMVKRGKMAAIAGMTLTTGIILSEMTPAVVYADTLHNSHTTESIKVNPNENNEQQSNMSQNSAIISKQNTYSVQQTKTTSQDKCTFNLVGKVLTIHEGLLSGSDLRNYLNQFGKTTKSTITEIIIDSNVTFDEKVPGLFENFKNVTNISGLDTVNTSKTTDMSNMFTNDEKLKTVDINNFDVSHVSTFFKMFYKSSITILNLSKWVPLKLKNNYPFTGSMFDGTTILDISFPSNFNLVDSDIIKNGDTYTESIEDRTISKNINTSNLNQIFSLDTPTKVINLRKNNSMNASTPIPDSTDTKVHATLDGDKIADVKVHVSDIINNLGKTVTVAVPKVSGRFTTNKNVSIKISDTGELIPQGSIAFFDKLTDAAKQNLNAKSSVDNDPKFKVHSVDLTGKTLDTNNNISVDLPPVTGYSTKTKTVTFHVDPETGDVSQLGDPVVFTPMVISDNSSDSSNFYPTDTSTSTLQPIVPKPTTPTHKKSIKSAIRKVSALFKSKFVKLYTGDLKVENREVKAGSDWYSDEQMVVDGVTYYRISTDEWIAADDVYAYDSDPQVVTTKNGKNAELLSALGKISNRSLAPDTKWKSDRVININGKKYFRVSTNEFVSADDVQ